MRYEDSKPQGNNSQAGRHLHQYPSLQEANRVPAAAGMNLFLNISWLQEPARPAGGRYPAIA
jgi:hypothetical protein